MRRRATALAAACAALMASGCGIHYGTYDTWEPAPRLEPQPWSENTVFFRSFEHMEVTAMTGALEAIELSGEVAPWILEAAQQSLPFKAVSRTTDLAIKPKYALQGRLDMEFVYPWWSLLQLLDLWIHGFFGAPTIGVRYDMTFELTLFDSDFRPLAKWTAERQKGYLGNVWWMLFRGPSRRFQRDQAEFVRDAMAHVGAELREHMVTPEGNR